MTMGTRYGHVTRQSRGGYWDGQDHPEMDRSWFVMRPMAAKSHADVLTYRQLRKSLLPPLLYASLQVGGKF